MENYREKSPVVQAEQWMCTTEQYERLRDLGIVIGLNKDDWSCVVDVADGYDMICNLNDWIVINGELHYVITDEEFNKYFERE